MTVTPWHLNPLALAITLTAALAAPLAQAADGPAYSLTGDATFIGDSPVSTGFTFTALENAAVIALGFSDFQKDGLNLSHQVGLFSITGSLLASATVAAGTASTLVGDHRYALLASSFELQAGTPYLLAAHTDSTDGYRYGTYSAATLTTHPAIGISGVAGRYSYGSVLVAPTATAYDIYATPNMLLAGVVPEPGSWALMLGGTVLLAGVARRSRRG